MNGRSKVKQILIGKLKNSKMRMENGGWRIEDGGWRIEYGGLIKCGDININSREPQ